MKNLRAGHGCFPITEKETITKIQVMGGHVPRTWAHGHVPGFSADHLTEILDVEENKWKKGSPLPLEWNDRYGNPWQLSGKWNKGVESIAPPYLGFSVGGYKNDSRLSSKNIYGLKKLNENEYVWEEVKSMNQSRSATSVVNAPNSMFSSC